MVGHLTPVRDPFGVRSGCARSARTRTPRPARIEGAGCGAGFRDPVRTPRNAFGVIRGPLNGRRSLNTNRGGAAADGVHVIAPERRADGAEERGEEAAP
jgi:hypothetical protein